LIAPDLDFTSLRSVTSAEQWVWSFNWGIGGTAAVGGVLERWLQLPAGISGLDYFQCPECYELGSDVIDAGAATDDLVVSVIEPLERAQELFEQPWVSRMTSSLDAIEMTVDPVFVTNDDMGTVDNTHEADFITDCTRGGKREHALRTLVLSSGLELVVASERWLADNNMTEFEFLEAFHDVNALVIEETGASGEPTVLFDHSDTLFSQALRHNEALLAAGCGGCTSTASGRIRTGWWHCSSSGRSSRWWV
jgi:hypothetical protein